MRWYSLYINKLLENEKTYILTENDYIRKLFSFLNTNYHQNNMGGQET